MGLSMDPSPCFVYIPLIKAQITAQNYTSYVSFSIISELNKEFPAI